jgi:ubiquinone/menaquinone biosynthesis C-methylase UbiE
MEINDEIMRYYSSGNELTRLDRDMLEKVRTQEIIQRYLTKVPSKVLDVGGANGFYSFWLSSIGHEVHLIDPIPLHIKQAQQRSRETPKPPASISIGEARRLEFPNNYFDILLHFGPLYHLTKRKERIVALSEARRVLHQDGVILCTAISRYSSLLDGFFHGMITDPHYVELMNQDLKDGQHRNPRENPGYFTTAYLHQPDELKEEIIEAGFEFREMLAIEGFGWLIPNFSKNWQDTSYRELLLKSIQSTEDSKSLVGVSGHIMCIASKPSI